MRDFKISTIYKNKSDRNDCNNYRGISLLSIVGKLFTRDILLRLQTLAERIYPESQYVASVLSGQQYTWSSSFDSYKRSTIMSLYIDFIDLTKAFDLVRRDGLFKVLPKIGCPPKLQSMVESFHTDTKGTVQFNGSSSEPFEICSGVKQGRVCGILFGLLLKHAFDTTYEIHLRTRSDGRPFNIACLRAKTNVRNILIRDMLFADDAAVATHTQEELQSLIDCIRTSD